MEKVWLKHYQPGVVTEINPDSYRSLNDMFFDVCSKFADNPCFHSLGKTITFRELELQSKNFAAYLQHKLKLVKGDRVAIMLPNILQYPIAMFGCLFAGLIVVNVNPLYTATELKHQLKDSGAKAILVLENFANVVEQVVSNDKNCCLQHIIVTSVGDVFSFCKRQITNYIVRRVKKAVPPWNLPGHVCYTEVMRLGNELLFRAVDMAGNDVAFLQYTGGTTGIAKGAMLTHRNMVANILQASAWLAPGISVGKEIIITALPLYHIFSLTANCFTFMYNGGLNVLISNPRNIDGFIKEMGKFKFTAITGVNTLFNALLSNKNFNKLNFSHLKLSLGGGMAVQPSVAEQWQKLTKKPLLEAYGLTETSPAACINPLDIAGYNGFIGLPISSTEISIRDQTGKELGFGEEGELLIKGPQVMRGYWQQPAETDNVLTKDGWLHTGDIAVVNADGYVKIVDRKKDMILVSGFNVYPNEVESVIAAIAGVREVAVIGIKHDITGEFVKAFIVKDDVELTTDMVIAQCRQHLTSYKVPKVIEFRTELPKSNVGKILRRALKNCNHSACL